MIWFLGASGKKMRGVVTFTKSLYFLSRDLCKESPSFSNDNLPLNKFAYNLIVKVPIIPPDIEVHSLWKPGRGH